MRVLTCDLVLTDEEAELRGVTRCERTEIFRTADIITLHLPATPETKHLINEDTLRIMKPGVIIINTARGSLIDEAALKHSLEIGTLGGAAMDVHSHEPPENYDLVKMENVLATPHIAASTKEAQLKVAAIVAQEVLNFATGKRVENSVNFR